MELDLSKLSSREIEEKIGELEHMYADCFSNNVAADELHHIRKQILDLQKELRNRNNY